MITRQETYEQAKDFFANHINSASGEPIIVRVDETIEDAVKWFESEVQSDGSHVVRDPAKCMAFAPWDNEPVMVVPMSAITTLTATLGAMAGILSVMGIKVPTNQDEAMAALRKAAETAALAYSSPYAVDTVSMSAPGPDGTVGVALVVDEEKLARINGSAGQPSVLRIARPSDPTLN